MQHKPTFLSNFFTKEMPSSNSAEGIRQRFLQIIKTTRLNKIDNSQLVDLVRSFSSLSSLLSEYRGDNYLKNKQEFLAEFRSIWWGPISRTYLNRIASFSNIEFLGLIKALKEIGVILFQGCKFSTRTFFKLKKVLNELKPDEYKKFAEVLKLIKHELKQEDYELLTSNFKKLKTPQNTEKLPDLLSSIEKTLDELRSEYTTPPTVNKVVPDGTQINILMNALSRQTTLFLIDHGIVPIRATAVALVKCFDPNTGDNITIKSYVLINTSYTAQLQLVGEAIITEKQELQHANQL